MSIFDRRPEDFSLEERAARGKHAEGLLRDEILQSIMEEAELSMLLNWLNTNGPDVQARERAWMGVASLGILERELTTVVNDGVVAGERLRKQQ